MPMPQEEPLSARFASLAAAEQASARLRQTGCEARVGVTGEDYVVTLADPGDRRDAARAALESAGGQLVAATGSHAPRPVQPGFTDAAPGIVPEETAFAAEPAETYEDAGGRFARQVESAPETPKKP